MPAVKPDADLWHEINMALLDADNLGVAVVTILDGMSQLLIVAGVCRDTHHARAHIAAMLLSPDDMDEVGSLVDLLPAELRRLADGSGLN